MRQRRGSQVRPLSVLKWDRRIVGITSVSSDGITSSPFPFSLKRPMPTYRPCVSVVCGSVRTGRSHGYVGPGSGHVATATCRRSPTVGRYRCTGLSRFHPLASRFQVLMRLSCLFNVMGEIGRSVDQTAVRSPESETWQRCLVSSPRRLLRSSGICSARAERPPTTAGVSRFV
jgi:hypothetical protein